MEIGGGSRVVVLAKIDLCGVFGKREGKECEVQDV